jgi:hypothetical protein
LCKSSNYKVNLCRQFRTYHDEVLYGLYKTGYVARLEENESMQNISGENSWTMSAWKTGNKMEIIRRRGRKMELSKSKPWF